MREERYEYHGTYHNRSMWLWVAAVFINVCILIGLALYRDQYTPATPDLKQKAAELDAISTSLKKLAEYVSDQKIQVNETYKTLAELQMKRLETEKALSINQESLKSLTSIMSGSDLSKWLDRILGFFLGTLSSVIASYVWEKKVKPRC